MSDDLKQLEELVQEINEAKNSTGFGNTATATTYPTLSTEPITDETINEFILKQSTHLINQGLNTVDQLKDSVSHGNCTAEELDAYSKLIASVSGSIEILNKINIQNKKSKAAKELKELDIQTSQKMLEKYNDNTKKIENQTNNIYIGTREQVMDMINEANNKDKPIDVIPIDTPN